MVGQARFTYTDADMIGTQTAALAWLLRPRHLLLAYALCVVLTAALFLALNARSGTATTAQDWQAALLAPLGEVALLPLLLFWYARNHGAQVLRGNRALAWNGDAIDGEHVWTWDAHGLRIGHARGHADLAWSAVGAWLASPDVVLLVPAGGRAFSLPASVLAAGWKDAPKVFFMPQGGYGLALPRRAVSSEDAAALLDALRNAGIPERRRFGLLAAKLAGAPEMGAT